MHRYRFLLFRPLQLLPVLFGISVLTFVMVRSIPGDPARILLGVRSTPAALARVRAQFGLDQPLWLQYFYFLRNLLNGELGRSIVYRVDTLKLIVSRMEPTLWLIGGSVLLALLLTVPLAATAARRQGRLADQLIRLFSTGGLGFPAFWLGIMMILLFSVTLGWFPVSGYGADWLEQLHHMVLPCMTVALALSAVLTRNLRASLIMEMRSDYVTAAQARGQPGARIFWRHVMPNSLIPTINLLADLITVALDPRVKL
ncbi:ABC transporter permease [Gibbsiella greigii]